MLGLYFIFLPALLGPTFHTATHYTMTFAISLKKTVPSEVKLICHLPNQMSIFIHWLLCKMPVSKIYHHRRSAVVCLCLTLSQLPPTACFCLCLSLNHTPEPFCPHVFSLSNLWLSGCFGSLETLRHSVNSSPNQEFLKIYR